MNDEDIYDDVMHRLTFVANYYTNASGVVLGRDVYNALIRYVQTTFNIFEDADKRQLTIMGFSITIDDNDKSAIKICIDI